VVHRLVYTTFRPDFVLLVFVLSIERLLAPMLEPPVLVGHVPLHVESITCPSVMVDTCDGWEAYPSRTSINVEIHMTAAGAIAFCLHQ
jgi:hypothetical protein